jgi:hypothetical protein
VALTINHSSTNGKSLLIKLGVTKEALAELLDKGWDVKLTAKHLTFVKGEMAQGVPVDLATLNSIAAGTLGIAQKAQLVQHVKAAMQGALLELPNASWVAGATTPLSPEPMETEASAGITFVSTGLGKPKDAPPPKPAAPVAAVKWTAFDPKKMKTAATVKLRDATQMYQPVHGTSQGSRYFLVGANEDVKIAARLQNGTLSIRIEGNGWKAHQTAILACGFDNHGPAKDYTSLHVVVGHNSVLANKTLGAVLTGLGIPLETPIPNAKLLEG